MTTSNTEKVSVKRKVLHELRHLAAIFVYLSTFFIVFRVYTRMVLAEYEIDYFAYGLSLLKSLALAKIILTGQALGLGERFRARPLILPTLYKTVVFSVFTLAFEVLEHLLLGWVRGRSAAEVVAEFLDKGWAYHLAMTMVVFVAFLPFFAFRETERVLGEGRLQDLFFRGRTAAEPHELRVVRD
jgi:hypothetical protein